VSEIIEILTLCGFAFFAGLIDAVVGGGGLIQLPTMLIMLPQMAIASILGTSKFVSMAGTAIAVNQYAKQQKIDWQMTIPAMITAFIFSFLGARTTSLLNPSLMRPVILVLLIAVAIYTFSKKDFGLWQSLKVSKSRQYLYSIAIGSTIGFYDGFFGPGTGSFLLFALVLFLGIDFIRASTLAKLMNVATNIAALAYFIPLGQIDYRLGFGMAAANVAGSIVGVQLALTKGARFVRIVLIVVVVALLAKQVHLLITQ